MYYVSPAAAYVPFVETTQSRFQTDSDQLIPAFMPGPCLRYLTFCHGSEVIAQCLFSTRSEPV